MTASGALKGSYREPPLTASGRQHQLVELSQSARADIALYRDATRSRLPSPRAPARSSGVIARSPIAPTGARPAQAEHLHRAEGQPPEAGRQGHAARASAAGCA
jgi:hypothetical protein